MRIVLINVPIREKDIPRNFPIGLGIIAQVLEDAGHDVAVVDINAHRYPRNKVLGVLEEAGHADVVGVSGLVSTYSYQKWLFPHLRRIFPKAFLVAGGGCVTSVPEMMMKHIVQIDAGVIGEGEYAFPELVKAVHEGPGLDTVKGIVYRGAGGWRLTEKRPQIQDLSSLPMPAYHLFPTDIYAQNPIWFPNNNRVKRSMNVISSRGCPMDCHFCYHLFGRRSFRQRSVASVIAEVRFLKERYAVDFIAFVDDNMTINKAYLLEFCAQMKETGLLWGCHGRVDCADDLRLAAMADAGCIFLGFGIESGSQRILDRMHKEVTVECARQALSRTRAHGIYPNATYIFGYPGEDIDSVRDTIRFQLSCGHYKGCFFATPYPGTPLYEQTRARGLIADEEAYVSSLNDAGDFTINLTDMSDVELLQLYNRMHSELELMNSVLHYRHGIDDEKTFLRRSLGILSGPVLAEDMKVRTLEKLADYFKNDKNNPREAALYLAQVRKLRGQGIAQEACL
jgi:anaerobic magnesium-protoporphyrin IX monomethyl ester cyclase